MNFVVILRKCKRLSGYTESRLEYFRTYSSLSQLLSERKVGVQEMIVTVRPDAESSIHESRNLIGGKDRRLFGLALLFLLRGFSLLDRARPESLTVPGRRTVKP